MIVPFVIIESLNDMSLPSKDKEHELIEKIGELLLTDYKNTSGFSRLREHQELIEGYFLKMKDANEKILAKWFSEKLEVENNVAPCASILLQLKWYDPRFHEAFLKNLHNDVSVWKWPIDSILRYYASLSVNQHITEQLRLKYNIISNEQLDFFKKTDLLRLITVLYGGYKDYHTPAGINEYCEIASFLLLAERESEPFILYYQEVWGKDDPTYQMACHLDNLESKKHWDEDVIFQTSEIYKDSLFTDRVLSLLKGINSLESIKHELDEAFVSLFSSREYMGMYKYYLELNNDTIIVFSLNM